MSLEQKVADLTKAVESLTDALPSRDIADDQVTNRQHAKEPAPPSESGVKQPEPPASIEGVDYSEVKAAALELAQAGGRDALVAVLKKRKLETAQDAKPAQYPALLAALQEAHRALSTDPA